MPKLVTGCRIAGDAGERVAVLGGGSAAEVVLGSPHTTACRRRTPMRAMQIIEWGKPLELRDYPTPEPTGGQVLVRVESAGVCHSDVHIWDGYFDLGGGNKVTLEQRGVKLPFTMGHEIAGE